MFVLLDLMLRKSLEVGAYLLTHIAENDQPLLLRPLDYRRIYEAMMPFCRAEKDRTALGGVVADRRILRRVSSGGSLTGRGEPAHFRDGT